MTAQYEFTHRRKNLLTNEWVLVSPHRNNRPWSGASEDVVKGSAQTYEATCPLCPSNTRANGQSNPAYSDTHVFTNDFAAVSPEIIEHDLLVKDDLFQAETAAGVAKVICFSPKHNKTLALMSRDEIKAVVDTWQSEYRSLSKDYPCVHIFENKGEIMGCSQPHPHGQIWAHKHHSTEITKEDDTQLAYYKEHGRALLSDYALREYQQQERVVIQNKDWLVVVPYWAKWPFETLVLSRTDVRSFDQLNNVAKQNLAAAIQELTVRYDNVFNCNFAYSMGWHSAPADLKHNEHWRLHAHFYPPLLRSASVKKHMVGYEMLAESQRDLSAETAAKILKSVSCVHYSVAK